MAGRALPLGRSQVAVARLFTPMEFENAVAPQDTSQLDFEQGARPDDWGRALGAKTTSRITPHHSKYLNIKYLRSRKNMFATFLESL